MIDMGRWPRWSVSSAEFEEVVEQALQSVPRQFQELLENVAVIVEDEPTDEDLDEHEMDDDSELLGSFRGIPRTRMTTDALPMLPNRIAIFRGPILRTTGSRGEAVQEIRKTLVHELGHYFGLDDAGMPY